MEENADTFMLIISSDFNHMDLGSISVSLEQDEENREHNMAFSQERASFSRPIRKKIQNTV